MLSFIEQHINKVLRKVTKKYRFRFVGLEQEDEQKKADVRNKQIAGWRTINEIREEDGLDKFEEDWAKMPMNVQAVQMAQAAAQAEQQEKMMEQGGGGGFPGEGFPDGGGFNNGDGNEPSGSPQADDEEDDESGEEVQKSRKAFRELTKSKERTVRIVIE